MTTKIRNIFHLGLKEILGLWRDPLLLALIAYCFTMGVISNAKSAPDSITNAAIAILDQDQTQLSRRICDAFLPPMFATPHYLKDYNEINDVMDKGRYTFIVVIPPNFQEKVLANNNPEVQLNVDATRMSQAFTGTGYIQEIINDEVTPDAEALLASCYRSCLELAEQHNLQSIAFCCISTGVFSFPPDLAAEIAIRTVKDFLQEETGIQRVIFNVFKDSDLEIYQRLLT